MITTEKAIEVNGMAIRLLPDGYMIDRDLWNENIAKALAERENIEMTHEHWEVINYLRGYYEKFLIAPNIKVLVKHMKTILGEDKVDKKHLYTIFPSGPAYQGCKIAGLPKPKACVDG